MKALDNKLCSEVCLPGEWQSAEHELGGRRSLLLAPLLSPWDTHLLGPGGSCKKAWALLRCWKPAAERRVLEQERPCSGAGRKGAKSLPVLPIWPDRAHPSQSYRSHDRGPRLAFISSFGGRHQIPSVRKSQRALEPLKRELAPGQENHGLLGSERNLRVSVINERVAL